MKKGDTVRVWPHGDESLASEGTIMIISENQRAIAVAFGDKPAFGKSIVGATVHSEHGVMLIAMREQLNGKPWGPWIDQFSGEHFEIE